MTTVSAPMTAELPPFRSFIRLESIDPEHNRYRFFILQWQPGLWQDRVLVRVWGRIGTPGRTRVLRHPDQDPATDRVHRILRLRLRHGYRVAAWT